MFCLLLLGKTISLYVCGTPSSTTSPICVWYTKTNVFVSTKVYMCVDSKGKYQVSSSVSPLPF